jgi:hypothetical protein
MAVEGRDLRGGSLTGETLDSGSGHDCDTFKGGAWCIKPVLRGIWTTATAAQGGDEIRIISYGVWERLSIFFLSARPKEFLIVSGSRSQAIQDNPNISFFGTI